MNNILSLINPARIINREGLMNLAREMTSQHRFQPVPLYEVESQALSLLQKFESLYALKLEKGHFVCEAEEPDSWNDDGLLDRDKYAQDVRVYNEQQAKVIFEGFEKGETTIVRGDYIRIGTIMFDGSCLINLTRTWIKPTIRDLLTEIEKYNETAAQKIELKYTSNILSLLKIEG